MAKKKKTFLDLAKGVKTRAEAEFLMKALLKSVGDAKTNYRQDLREYLLLKIKQKEANPGPDPALTAYDLVGLKKLLAFIDEVGKNKPKPDNN